MDVPFLWSSLVCFSAFIEVLAMKGFSTIPRSPSNVVLCYTQDTPFWKNVKQVTNLGESHGRKGKHQDIFTMSLQNWNAARMSFMVKLSRNRKAWCHPREINKELRVRVASLDHFMESSQQSVLASEKGYFQKEEIRIDCPKISWGPSKE